LATCALTGELTLWRERELFIDEVITVIINAVTDLDRVRVSDTSIAEVADPISVSVDLIGIRLEQTIITGVSNAITIDIGLIICLRGTQVTEVTVAIHIAICLVWIRELWTDVTGVADPISVLIKLSWVCDLWAEVARVPSPIAISVFLVRVREIYAVVFFIDHAVIILISADLDYSRGLSATTIVIDDRDAQDHLTHICRVRCPSDLTVLIDLCAIRAIDDRPCMSVITWVGDIKIKRPRRVRRRRLRRITADLRRRVLDRDRHLSGPDTPIIISDLDGRLKSSVVRIHRVSVERGGPSGVKDPVTVDVPARLMGVIDARVSHRGHRE
jgi:hypothetical protein